MNANLKACVSIKEEQFFILEVFIDSVTLYAEKLQKFPPNELGVDLQFNDMPLFRVFQTAFLLTKPDRSKEITRGHGLHTVNFNAGKIYLFTRNPDELVEKMRSKPLLLDVYRIKEIVICPEDVLKDPLGNAVIPIPGCLCDYVMMLNNDIFHLPKPYEIKNTFCLVDEEYKPTGYIHIFFRLTCFGTYTVHPFSIADKKLLFRNTGSFNEFLCTKVPYLDEDDRRAAEAGAKFCLLDEVPEESELETPPRPVNIVGLILACKELSRRDGYPLNIIPPNYPPKIPQVHVEEVAFDVDKARRKGFEEIVEEEPGMIADTKHRACINIRCPGNICSGQK
ncbi:hypothetical protein QLX08_009427 [Tetragonisca angustula]|uniref:Uncharacterized protein n=1 Tax=Tetragonisca angustula TaxID=166442 RepID=A0AAW0ZGE2_9HYME